MLNKNTFRYIEQEIYDFEETQKKFNELTEDIIHYTPPYTEIRTLEPADPTAKTATILSTHERLKHMERITYAIQISLIQMNPEHRDALEDKYWKRPYLKWEEVAAIYYVDVRTLYRWRRAFIEDVAKRIGVN